MWRIDWVITFCVAANDRTPKRWISLTACTPNFHFAHWPPSFKNWSALSTIARWAKKQLIKQTVQLMPYLSCQWEGFAHPEKIKSLESRTEWRRGVQTQSKESKKVKKNWEKLPYAIVSQDKENNNDRYFTGSTLSLVRLSDKWIFWRDK